MLIFCATKKGSDNLSSFLSHECFYNIAIHGDKGQRDRDRALDEFRSNRKRIMIATDVASRGLDIRGVTYVIDYDFSNAIDDYVHRIGRTRSTGDKGTSISFLDPDDDGKVICDLIQMLTDAGH
jgi:superfamily II DNA/RNA helicase